jgi:hypothetical protein
MPVNLMMGVQEEFSRMVELMPYKKESDFQNELDEILSKINSIIKNLGLSHEF